MGAGLEFSTMIYQTNWIPSLKRSLGPRHFLLNSLVFHLARGAVRAVFPQQRNPGRVKHNYDQERAELARQLNGVDWDAYTGLPDDWHDFIVVNDEIRWGALREARMILLQRLVSAVREHVKPGQTVIEFGSGDGRNLLYLKRLFPDVRFVGLELSSSSVDVSNQFARKFGIEGVRFVQANVCEPLPDSLTESPVGLIFSSFALEQMPRIFKGALTNMLSLEPHAIALFEPIPELWGDGLRARVARVRARAIDRLRHLPAVLQDLLGHDGGYCVVKMERSGIAINPHTEMCEVLVVRCNGT